MAIQPISIEREVAGRKLIVGTGGLALEANGAVTVQYGDSVVLVTSVASEEADKGADFLPLIVDFEEKMYAAGRIPGHRFYRREGKPSDSAILSARLIDRSIRPLFPEGMVNDVQIVVTALSSDGENHLDIPGLIGASTALHISDIPFFGPIAAVRVGLLNGELVVNPTYTQLQASQLDLIVAGTRQAVMMIEAGAGQVPEDLMLEAIKLGHQTIQLVLGLQEELRAQVGKPKRDMTIIQPEPEMVEAVKAEFGVQLKESVRQTDKRAREASLKALKEKVLGALSERYIERETELKMAFEKALKYTLRRTIIEEGAHANGRALTDVRPISCQVGLSPRAHGSALFQRGETQVMTIITLGATTDEMLLDSLMAEEESKRFMHQYNFPPFSVGEVRPLRGPGRREIGHGALAERALEPVIPNEDSFAYTIRLVSEVLSSDGSTSMASVCASTLCLMDAGVPILAPVAGVSIGLVQEPDATLLLTDIQGLEDACGDMDFKIAGTREGITAIQLDLKVRGISFDLIAKAFERAKAARLYILDKMAETIAQPREHLSPFAPRIIHLNIPVSKIGDVIGPRGKHIRDIESQTNAKIEIEDDGTVFVTCPDLERAEKAKQMVLRYTAEVVPGEVYKGKVTKIGPDWALVEVLPGKEGLLHVSEVSRERVASIASVLKIGDEVEVKVLRVEDSGKIRLSRKELLPLTALDVSKPAISKPAISKPASSSALDRDDSLIEIDGSHPYRLLRWDERRRARQPERSDSRHRRERWKDREGRRRT